MLNLNELAHTSGEWLRGSGPESDIVISSRMRLARNLAEFPFITRASKTDRTDIESLVRRPKFEQKGQRPRIRQRQRTERDRPAVPR